MKKKLYIFIIFLLFSFLSLWSESKFSYAAWKKLSRDEKKIVLLSSFGMNLLELDYCDFKCEDFNAGKYTSIQDFLNQKYKINDKVSLKKYYETTFDNTTLKAIDSLNSNPGKTYIQIIDSNNRSGTDAGALFYFYENRSKLGKHLLNAYYLQNRIFVTRLAYSAGLISKSEMIKYSAPFVEEALKCYKNLEDYAAHQVAYFFEYDFNLCFIAQHDYDPDDDADYINIWKEIINILPIDEIKFSGVEADKDSVMKLEDAFYVPSDDYKLLFEFYKNKYAVPKHDMYFIVHKCYEKYGQYKLFSELIDSIYPPRYSERTKKTQTEFFEEHYREIWEKLEEYEKFAVACSSNIFERNSQYHLDIANEVIFKDYSREGKKVLNDSWHINNRKELMKAIKELSEGEQNPEVEEYLELLKKYPDLTIIEICEKVNYNMIGLTKFNFVDQMKDVLGFHGIEAWDAGRLISIIRWGISAGYLSYKEGIDLIKPITEKLKDDYWSFEDFIAHWLAGYCYNNLYGSTTENWLDDVLEAIENSRAYIPFEELQFTGKNADKNHRMTIQDGIYNISENSAKYIPAYLLHREYNNNEDNKSTLAKLIEEEKKYPEISNITFYLHYLLMCKYSSSAERVAFVEAKADYLKSIDQKEYEFFIKGYFHDLLNINKCEKILELYDSLPQELKINEDFYYFYGYANYLKSLKCESIIERDIYASRAITALSKLRSMGYELDTFLIYYLENSAY